MNIKSMACAIGLLTVSSFSMAQTYVGVGATTMDFEISGADKSNMSVAYGVLGSQLNENLAMELRLGTGVQDGDFEYQSIEFDTELEQYVGAYLKVGAPVTQNIYPYAVIGMTRIKMELSAMGVSESAAENEVSYGAGVRFGNPEDVQFAAEYIQYYDDAGEEFSGISVNAVWAF